VKTLAEVRIGRSMTLPRGVTGLANFSEDRRYRWWLSRTLGVGEHMRHPTLFVIGTNPSSAGADRDDSTIRVLEHLAIRMQFGRLIMLNAFALCSTDYAAVEADFSAAVGSSNDDTIQAWLRIEPAATVLCAWGDIPRWRHDWLMRAVIDAAMASFCLGRTAKGNPRHPLRTQTRELYPYP
jgi:hypothetical protein